MNYKVKLKDTTNVDRVTATPDGYLANWLDETQPAVYPRGEAIKKAKVFDGVIEAIPYTIEVDNSSMIKFSAKLLNPAVKEFLRHREKFEGINSFIYEGEIFLKIHKELKDLEDINDDFKIKDEVATQLNELSQVVNTEFVLINDMCFS